MKFTTKAIHSGYARNKEDGAVIPPLHLTTTFEFGNQGGYYDGSVSDEEWQKQKEIKFNNNHEHVDNARTENQTRLILESTMAALDGNRFGLAYSSGSAALANIVALLKQDEVILFSSDAYGGTYRFIVKVAGAQGLQYRIVDLTDPAQTEAALKQGAVRIIWVETPTNPLLKVVDIEVLATLAKTYGALLVVDNTFASPALQQPAALGADIVAYSTTKYINGHSDSIGGMLTLSDETLYARLKFLQNAIGAILSPFDSWLTLRGLKTLDLRMQRHQQNAVTIADMLVKHSKIRSVYFPGLFTGEQGAIVKKQMKGPGGMISFEIKEQYDAGRFIKALTLIPLAESLGGIESLLDHPASMTHGSIPREERLKIGLTDGLMRLSVGIEDAEDLVGDLLNALDKV